MAQLFTMTGLGSNGTANRLKDYIGLLISIIRYVSFYRIVNCEFKEGYLDQVIFEDESIQNFTENHIKEILSIWLNKVASLIQKEDVKLIEMKNALSILYRYIQWGSIIGSDNRSILNNYLVCIMQNNQVADEIKRNFCKRFIAANDFNAYFQQESNENKIYEELFDSIILKSTIETFAAN